MNQAQRPFIPQWLNVAGLSQADFRVYACLSSRADNQTGIAWPKAETIAKDCCMARNTVWKSIRSLEKLGLIQRVGKPFQGSSRYRILLPSIGANEIPIEGESTSANEIPIEPLPIGANETPPIGANEILQSAQTRRRECSPKNVLHRTKSNPSPEGFDFADWFKSTLPETINLKSSWRDAFAKAYDDLVRLDKRAPEAIRAVSAWARADSFWSENFMSPLKLRDRTKDGIQYFDLLAGKMKSSAGASAQKAAKPHRQGEYPEHELRTAKLPRL